MSAAPEPPEIRLDDVTKRFGAVVAVDNVSLTVDTGEFSTSRRAGGSSFGAGM